MNNEIVATILEPPTDLISILEGLERTHEEIQLLPVGLLRLTAVTNANIEGALADRVGIVQNPACSRCETSARTFLHCSILEDRQLFHGACASCHSDGRDVDCSFYG